MDESLTKNQELKADIASLAKQPLKAGQFKKPTKEQKRMLSARVIQELNGLGGLFKEQSIKDPLKLAQSLPDVIESVEAMGKQFELAGNLKLDIVSEVVNFYVDIPYIPDFLEGRLIKFGIQCLLKGFEKLAIKMGLTKSRWLELFRKNDKKEESKEKEPKEKPEKEEPKKKK